MRMRMRTRRVLRLRVTRKATMKRRAFTEMFPLGKRPFLFCSIGVPAIRDREKVNRADRATSGARVAGVRRIAANGRTTRAATCNSGRAAW
jgi:hypothetical protein